MKRSELLARLIITTVVLGAIAIPLVGWARTPLIHARTAEAGGWSRDHLRAKLGEHLHLRLTSDDVVHGFAVGRMAMESVDVLPGKVTALELVFDQPGTYTFYCTRWCGLNHWRMRGTIEVSGDGSASPEPSSKPLYATLGLDIDAPHNAPSVPRQRPSAAQGEMLTAGLEIANLLDTLSYRSRSPYQAWQALRTDPALDDFTDQQLWDRVALEWQSNTSPEQLADGRKLYVRNCAACHGEKGGGDGVFAEQLADQAGGGSGTMTGMPDMTRQRPANFTDTARLLGASPAVLQGKILRGGMGTGMPMWGSIFSEDQIWNLVAYLYSFQFESN
jgi:mono/diheme cytochrome c family protein/plastocyanin